MAKNVLPCISATIDQGIRTVPTPKIGSISTNEITMAKMKLFFIPKIRNPERSCAKVISKRSEYALIYFDTIDITSLFTIGSLLAILLGKDFSIFSAIKS